MKGSGAGVRANFELWGVTGLTFIAAIFRLGALTARSLWLDEGYSLFRIYSSWELNLRNQIMLPRVGITPDPHPPIYFLLVKAITELAGREEIFLKLLSGFAGVISVPLLFVMGRRLFNRRVGMLLALFGALSPLIAWYSDELRGYSLLVSEAALCIYLAHAALTKRGAWRWVGWGAALLAALFTHWAFVGFVLAHLLALAPQLGRWAQTSRKTLAFVVMSLLAGAAAFAWLFDAPGIFKRMTTGAEYGFSFVPLHTFVASIFSGAVFGVNLVDPTHEVLVWLAAIFFVVCLVVLWKNTATHSSKLAWYLVAASAILPPAVWFGFSLIKPNYHGVRHLIMALPPILAVFAAGIDVLQSGGGIWQKRAGRLALAGLLMGFAAGSVAVYAPTPEKEDNWREMAQVIRDGWQPGDVLLGNAGTPLHVLRSYVGAQVPITTLTTGELGDMSEAEQTQFLRAHNRVWFANTGGVSLSKGEATQLAGGRVLKTYHAPARTTTLQLLLIQLSPTLIDELPKSAQLVQAQDDLAQPFITAYAINPGSPFAKNPAIRLSLFWKRGSQDVSTNLALRLEHNGELWMDWNGDARLQDPPANWMNDTLWQMDYDVPVPLGLPNQAYQLKLTADADGRAQVVDQTLPDAAIVCCLRVANWTPSRVSIPQLQTDGAQISAVSGVFRAPMPKDETGRGSVAQLGGVALVNAIHPSVVRPGDALPVALNWQVMQTHLAGWDNAVNLDGALGGSMANFTRPSGASQASASEWNVGEIYRDQLALQIPNDAKAGVYRLGVSRKIREATLDTTQIGLVQVEDYPHSAMPTGIANALEAKIGEMTLLGWQPPSAFVRGETMPIHTFWRFDSQPGREGVLFIHIISADGVSVAQYDNAPLDGKRATQTYRAGDGLDQINPITLNYNLPGGEYTIYAGVYTRQDVVRWQATQNGAPAKDNLVKLGAFTLPALVFKQHLPLVTK